ncbi:MAG: hypothetical protein NTZ70_04975 [Methylococcales bacterium]|nr:hypothetical protein [Methylococcales bacterium]
MIFHVTLEDAEDGWMEEKEALINIQEAISAWLWAEDQKAIVNLPPI